MNRKNEIENDIVFAKFINYMQKALLHKKMNYIRDKNRISQRECSIDKLENCIHLDKEDNSDIFKKILSERELKILKLHILEKQTYEEISRKYKLKPESIRMIKYRAIKKVKEWRKRNAKNWIS